jgi:streptothricin acetyltransferase
MKIQIKRLDQEKHTEIDRCDNSFWVENKLSIDVIDDRITYSLVPAHGFEKHYLPEQSDYSDYLNNPDKAIYLAYADEQLAGQIILRKNWNGYAYIEDITVDKRFRRLGIGRQLMLQAVEWTKTLGLPGIMLETSNVNVDACKFYEHFGFKLGGFDRFLYQAALPDTEEVALFWYFIS